MSYTVYKHTNKINGKVYIGITSMCTKERWRSNGRGYKTQYFYRAIKKYGWDNFDHCVLKNNLTKEKAELLEIELIKKYKSSESEYGYNIENGGNSIGRMNNKTKEKLRNANLGKIHTEKTKKLMSTSRIGTLNGMYGKTHTKEVKSKLSKFRKGSKQTEEAKAKISKALIGNKYNLGKHASEVTRIKMSESKKGGKNHNAKRVICDGVIFGSTRELSEYFNINRSTMKSWLNGQRKMPQLWIDLGLRYYDEEVI